jgi:hypothetical protein
MSGAEHCPGCILSRSLSGGRVDDLGLLGDDTLIGPPRGGCVRIVLLSVSCLPAVARGRQMMMIFIDIRCLIPCDYENVDLHVRLMSSLIPVLRPWDVLRAGSPSWWADFSVCAARFMAPRERGRIKTPVAAAVSAAGGTWMGPHASTGTVVSCPQLLWRVRLHGFPRMMTT